MSGLSSLFRFFAAHPLTRDDQLRAWARFAAWQIKSRLQKEVIVPWIKGQRLAIRRGMTGATGNIYVGLHEFHDMMLPLHFLRRGDLFLDIGANVGSYTILASGVCGATTWAFEPDPVTVRHLRRNVSLNELSQLVSIREVALGAAEGKVLFSVGKDTMNKVEKDESHNPTQIVLQKRLDDVIECFEPIMIKVDVEGYELDVLRGAEAVLSKQSLKIIEIETVEPEAEAALHRHGFRERTYDPFVRRLFPASDDNAKGASANVVFARDIDFIQARLAAADPVFVLGRSI